MERIAGRGEVVFPLPVKHTAGHHHDDSGHARAFRTPMVCYSAPIAFLRAVSTFVKS